MLGISDDEYRICIEKSLISCGNKNGKLVKNVLEKLRGGKEEVYLAAIGGSVTEGAGPAFFTDGYAFQFAQMLKEKYAAAPEKVSFDGAGLGGTPSVLGLIRYEKDVVKVLGHTPDLLVIEFAVNDWLECSNTRAYEALIRNALENGTAIITIYAAATYENQQAAHIPVADFYGIPEVSIKDALKDSNVNQEKDTGIYYADYVHPVKEGHTLMAQCLMNVVQKIDEEIPAGNYSAEIPQNYKNEKSFTNFAAINSNSDFNALKVKISAGDFSKKDGNSQVLMKSKTDKSFPDNWFYDGCAENPEGFKIELECKALILVYKHAGGGNSVEFGKADVFVDGVKTATYDGAEAGGWNDCKIVMVIDEEKSANHIVEIKMNDDSKNKGFTILSLGFTK